MNYLLNRILLCFFLSQGLIFADSSQLELSCKTPPSETFNKYKQHIENTTWVVPPETLLAYEYVSGNNIAVSDQTVWTINNYDNGYFFGNSYTSINQVSFSQMHLVGSITPLGDVYITFYPASGELEGGDVVDGIGKFEKIEGKYVFIMQMNSAQNNVNGLSHWSYMISVTPDSYFYRNLPGEDMSVPQFLSQF